MSEGMTAGLQTACFGILVIIAVYLSFNRRQESSLDLLLSAAAVLAVAHGFHFFNMVSRPGVSDLTARVSGGLAAALDLFSAAAMGGFFWLWKPGKENGSRRAAMQIALIPIWLAGLVWIFTRRAALFPIAETFSLLILVMFYQRGVEMDLKRRAEEIENHQAMVFQWQMRPHFLFNTLHTIRELMDSDPALAGEGIDNLAGYLRKNLDALTSDQMIPFSQELSHIRQYVMLEKMNPANQFEVVYDLQILDFSLPALSVQPLVENAIRHGVRSLGSEGIVFLTTERHGEMIRIVVEDNGPGIPEGATCQQKDHASQGLANVRKRLETQCGGSLHIKSDPEGTRLIVLIPNISQSEGEDRH